MKNISKILLTVALLCAACGIMPAQTKLPVIHTVKKNIGFSVDGNLRQWTVWSKARPDVLETSAKRVIFYGDSDSLLFDIKKGGVYNFVILQNADSAFVRICYKPTLAERLKNVTVRNGVRILSREQALADIDTLTSYFSEIHPDMFGVCKSRDFFLAVNDVKKTLPDSVSEIDFYRRVAPLITMIGDGHSYIYAPKILSEDSARLYFPLNVSVNTNDSTIMVVKDCSSNKKHIPEGARIISINNINYRDVIERLLPYSSGERTFFRIKKIDYSFRTFMNLLFGSEEYSLEYEYKGKVFKRTVPAIGYAVKKSETTPKSAVKRADYSFYILPDNKTAVMDFYRCNDNKRFVVFADSMFTILKNKNIENLIIDMRDNGGGSSIMGDELFQYISPVPFSQFGGAIVRFSPLTKKLIKNIENDDVDVEFSFYDDGKLVGLRKNPKRFSGKVYMLVSHFTFSAAAGISWAFKYFKMGTVVGEESGGMNVSFGEFVPFTLPCSKLVARASCKKFYQYGAKESDIHGTLPDYKVPAKDALDFTINLIEKGGK